MTHAGGLRGGHVSATPTCPLSATGPTVYSSPVSPSLQSRPFLFLWGPRVRAHRLCDPLSFWNAVCLPARKPHHSARSRCPCPPPQNKALLVQTRNEVHRSPCPLLHIPQHSGPQFQGQQCWNASCSWATPCCPQLPPAAPPLAMLSVFLLLLPVHGPLRRSSVMT